MYAPNIDSNTLGAKKLLTTWHMLARKPLLEMKQYKITPPIIVIVAHSLSEKNSSINNKASRML